MGIDLALFWTAVDPTTWEFRLRPSACLDDGTPFTTKDVAFTHERAGNAPGSLSSFGIYTAQRLLREAGYPEGFGLTLHCPNDRYVND